MAYGPTVVMRDLEFEIQDKEIFVIMGGSGCGKSTLLRHLVGLTEPAKGRILYDGEDFTAAQGSERSRFIRRFGVMYQWGALWSSLTLGENISMLIEEAGKLPAKTVRDLVAYKLALVGLAGYEDYYPAQMSGGMKKRAGIARAMALDPDLLFLDEPSGGLDPLSSRRVDELIAETSAKFGVTSIVITHDMASVLQIGHRVNMLYEGRIEASSTPSELLRTDNPRVRDFLIASGVSLP
jgi:phospholipid/cholesterol/gamma-HCH transport system ATP-binding protein